MPAVAQGVVLHPVVNLINVLPTGLHHLEGVQDGDRLRWLVADGVGVAVERVRCRCADPARQSRPLLGEPVTLGSSCTACDQIPQPGSGPAVRTAGVVRDGGDYPGAGRIRVAPDVLVDAQGVDPGQPVLGAQLTLDDGADGVPHGVPGDPGH